MCVLLVLSQATTPPNYWKLSIFPSRVHLAGAENGCGHEMVLELLPRQCTVIAISQYDCYLSSIHQLAVMTKKEHTR